ncbi:protein translocase subunit SecF [bacterium]|nr:protein translocase subunit SecF [bacterium]
MNIDFLGKRKTAYFLSGLMILIGIVSLIVRGGANYGLDFTGGTLVHLKFEREVSLNELGEMRKVLEQLNLGKSIQQIGEKKDEIMIKVKERKEDMGALIEATLKEKGNSFEVLRTEMIGPSVSRDLRKIAFASIFFVFVGILFYITLRFELKFALGAVLALIHDILITVGSFSLLNKEFDIPIVAALLTIVGYSLNDTIVIFDRIRENLKVLRKEAYIKILNVSINQTLSRTIITSLTTLFAIVALYALGGTVIHDFAFALIVGVVVGTYSSIFIANPFLLEWENRRDHH